jgi:dTDP-4-dehydrorhamnose 3,5-epimerase
MAYKVTPTSIDGVLVLEPHVFGDARGFFFESFNQRDFSQATGIDATFVQDNHSKSAKGVLRGLHFQNPKAQGKLVRVTAGEVFDVAVDLRVNSSTLGQSMGILLSADNKKQLWIPPGLAHGFLVTSTHAEFLYKTTDYWHPEHEHSLQWSDPDLGIDWPLELLKDDLTQKLLEPQLAKKDAQALSWAEYLKQKG